MEQLVKEIIDWQNQAFPNSTGYSKLMHLQKEIGELDWDLRKGVSRDAIGSEISDCMFLLMGIADKVGLSAPEIIQAMESKLKINKERKWGQPDSHGVVEHVRDSESPGTI